MEIKVVIAVFLFVWLPRGICAGADSHGESSRFPTEATVSDDWIQKDLVCRSAESSQETSVKFTFDPVTRKLRINFNSADGTPMEMVTSLKSLSVANGRKKKSRNDGELFRSLFFPMPKKPESPPQEQPPLSQGHGNGIPKSGDEMPSFPRPPASTENVVTNAAPKTTGDSKAPSDCPDRPKSKLLQNLLTSGDVGSALASLPPEMKSRRVLFKKCAGAHKCDPENPRLMHFSPDGRDIITASGDSNELLVLSKDKQTHTSCLYKVNFSNGRGQPELANQECVSCHGIPPRFVGWGQYPKWDNTYGGNKENSGALDVFSSEEKTQFNAFVRKNKDNPIYRHLGLKEGMNSLPIMDSSDDRATTVLTAMVAQSTAHEVAERMSKHPSFDRYKYALLLLGGPKESDAARGTTCEPLQKMKDAIMAAYSAAETNPEFAKRYENRPLSSARDPLRVAAYRLLGIDPAASLRLDLVGPDVRKGTGDDYPFDYWTGTDKMGDMVDFNVLVGALKNDDVLQGLYASQKDVIQRVYQNAFARDSAHAMQLDRDQASEAPGSQINTYRGPKGVFSESQGPGIWHYIYRFSAGEQQKLCDHLREKAEGALK